MANNRHIVWTRESSNKVNEIKEYLRTEWSQKEIINFFLKLEKFEKIVKKFPYLYPTSIKYPELRRAVISKHQSVIYNVEGMSIRILTVLDNRQNNEY